MSISPHSRSLRASLQRSAERYHSQMSDRGRQYLAARGIGPMIDHHMLGEVVNPLSGHERFLNRLAIPFIGPNGNIYDVRFRCMEDHDCKEMDCPKYLGMEGVQTRLFNTRALVADTDYIIICEGEIDAIAISACGWQAVAVPGAEAWKPHHPRMFAGFSRVLVMADPDDAGRRLAAKVVRSMPSTASNIMVPAGHDINSYYIEHGKQGLVDLIRSADDDDM